MLKILNKIYKKIDCFVLTRRGLLVFKYSWRDYFYQTAFTFEAMFFYFIRKKKNKNKYSYDLIDKLMKFCN